MKTTIFALTNARSGTLYLRNLFRNNAVSCDCRHEVFFDWQNPTMFGRVIYDAYAGRLDKIRARLEKKRAYIQRLRGSIYLESSHSFLKSAYVAARELFPEMKLVHLVRHPIEVARSEAYREILRRRFHAPFHFYRGDDGRRHFVWALTGNEEIFQIFRGEPLTMFQWYLIQWVEIENRAMNYLDEFELHDRCFTLDAPRDLNNALKIREMFDFLDVPTRQGEIIFGGRKNQSLGYSDRVTADNERECAAVLEKLPVRYLEIFQREPYVNFRWSGRFLGAKNLSAVSRE
jgi:hypothetical protein